MPCFPVDPLIPAADDQASMNPRSQAGFTWVELLVIIVIIFVLSNLSIHELQVPPGRARLFQSLSNMKQIHLTSFQMALDGATTGDKTLGWPGSYATSEEWIAKMVPEYLSTNDLCRMLSVPGSVVSPSKLPKMKKTAFRVYAVTGDSPADAVMFTTANFTNTPTGGTLNTNFPPFGTNGFAVFRKGGDGAIYRPNHVGQTNIIGSFVPMCR